jgi:hypothetical protein
MGIRGQTNTGLSSSFVNPSIVEGASNLVSNLVDPERPAEAAANVLNWKTTWGVYCCYIAIGGIADFFTTFLTAPTLCQYVFGPMGDGPGAFTTVNQCNVAPSFFSLPWNFKIFFGFFLDVVPFFGSRRKGWIIFGWTGAVVMLLVASIFAQHLIDTHQFEVYLSILTGMCFFYTFSLVAADGMVVEMSRLESDDNKGYILTTAQMLRFGMSMVMTTIGTLVMSGPSYQPPGKPSPGTLVLPFELGFGQVHMMLLAVAIPLYIGMCVLLRDPPVEHHEPICKEAKSALINIWSALKSFAVFMLLIQCVGSTGISSMQNPANQGVASISKPTNIQSGIGAVVGNVCMTAGVWVFRKLFMNTNWRVTTLLTQTFVGIAGGFSLMAIYCDWARNGWFYMIQTNVPQFIQGVGQTVSSLAVLEVAPEGLEATVYELLCSSFNSAISLSVALQSSFTTTFQLGDITSTTWEQHPAMVPIYQHRLASATIFTLVVNIAGAVLFYWFLPRNAEHCREWVNKKSWHKNRVAVANFVLLFGPLIYANYETFSFMLGS